MMDQGRAAFMNEHITPSAVEIEEAKSTILEALSQLSPTATPMRPPVDLVRRALCDGPSPVPPGYTTLSPDLNEVKAIIITYEALQALHAEGAVVAYGGSPPSEAGSFGYTDERGGMGPVAGVTYQYPSVHGSYRLAMRFQGDRFLLADGDVYLSRLPKDRLPSRVQRCLREAVSAFRHGDYLGAAMLVGAASESMWMQLGRLMCDKRYPGTEELADDFEKGKAQVGNVIRVAWGVITARPNKPLRAIFANQGEQEVFKSLADRLRDRRNYANHDEEANEDEPLFRFNETGMLLLDATKYFKQLIGLKDAIEANTIGP
jgi:hypothetical protein